MKISPIQIPNDGKADVSITTKNIGKVQYSGVVQLYIRDMISKVATPVLSLKDFCRITFELGESGVVIFKIGAEELSLWDMGMKRVVEPGEFEFLVGKASNDIVIRKTIEVRD